MSLLKKIGDVCTSLTAIIVFIPAAIGFVVFLRTCNFSTQSTNPPAKEAARVPLPDGHDREAAIRDLQRLDPDKAKQRRYLSLLHLHNDPSLSDEFIQSVRDALRDLAGHLSPTGVSLSFAAIDAEKLVYVFDTEEFQLDASARRRCCRSVNSNFC